MNILELKGVRKCFKNFQLGPLDLCLPQGSIMGYIGKNGAGKSTTIRLILGLLSPDAGSISFNGQELTRASGDLKEKIGFVFDHLPLSPDMRVQQAGVFSRLLYKNWEPDIFSSYCQRFQLPPKQKIKELSRGMKMKLSLALALSHQAELLLLDEATSGLDPVVRDEILDLLLEFIQDEKRSVLISSHILSDLEKAADYISFLHEGKLVFVEEKDRLEEKYGILQPNPEEEAALDPESILGRRRHHFGVELLVDKQKIPVGTATEKASLEDLVLFLIKGEKERNRKGEYDA